MKQAESSVHFNSSLDDRLFCGDGYKAEHGKAVVDSQWIEVLYPRSLEGSVIGPPYTGVLRSQKLVNMAKHNYGKVEPNVRFSPDHKLVIFTSNMFGPTYVFAVEVKPSPLQ